MSEIMTRSHKMFDPLHPDAELIDIKDIAHSLSMLCRQTDISKASTPLASTASTALRKPRPGVILSLCNWLVCFTMPVRLTCPM